MDGNKTPRDLEDIQRLRELIEYGKRYAQQSDLKFKHCTLITRGTGSNRKIVAKGYNRYIMDLLNHNHSVHSEVAALEEFIDNHVSFRLPKHKRIQMAQNIMRNGSYDMIVVRIGQQNFNKVCYSMPCKKCQKKLKQWPLRNIFYTTEIN